jgi:hypothetical protein
MKKAFFIFTVLSLFQLSTVFQENASILAATPKPFPTPTFIEDTNSYGRGVRSNPGQPATETEQAIKFRNFKKISSLYRSSTKEELKKIAVNDEDIRKYSSFLKNNRAKLTRLVPNLSCSRELQVIATSSNCLEYSMPGNGAAYSFRVKDYRLSHLADITLSEDSLKVTGKTILGILVNIGDISFEKIEEKLPELKYLTTFQPPSLVDSIVQHNKNLQAGISQDGFLYKNAVSADENATYILRSIAYDTTSYRSLYGIKYDEMKFDSRKDITVGFRIIRREQDGTVTLLWKELDRKKSPKITMK